MTRKNSKQGLKGRGWPKSEKSAAPASGEAPDARSAIKKIGRGGSAGGGLVTTDPLSRYLSTVRNIAKLSAEEEHELAVLVHAKKDQEAALKLITANLWLVVNIAFEFRSQIQNILDLIQEGNIGLMRGIQKFDPFKGVRLPAYASYWVRAYILKYILNNWRLVRVGTTNMRRTLLFNLNKVTHEMRAAGIDPSPKLLANHFSTSEENIQAVQQSLASRDVSFETPVSEGSTLTFAETIGSGAPEMDDAVGEAEIMGRFKKEVAEFSKTLKDSDKVILQERLMSDEPMTLAKIGERFGVSREAMRQAEERLINRLKKHLQEKVPGLRGLRFEPGDKPEKKHG
jgi:RNA polymerase sigma-32 factor